MEYPAQVSVPALPVSIPKLPGAVPAVWRAGQALHVDQSVSSGNCQVSNHGVVYSNAAWAVRNSDKALQTVMEHAGTGFRVFRVEGFWGFGGFLECWGFGAQMP